MNILGTGIDIVENIRFKKLFSKRNLEFKKRLFTSHEISYCEKGINKINCYSKRFAKGSL